MASNDDQEQRRADAARATWEDLAVKARVVHCPDHYAQPWRISLLGDSPSTYRLYVSGCCPKLGEAVTAMIRSDARIAASE